MNPEPIEGFQALHHLDPRRIMHELDQHPPLQRGAIGASYAGQRVEWPLIYRSGDADARDLSRLRLSFQYERLSNPIIGYVNAAAYPQFNRLPAGTVVTVTGAIERIETLAIYLTDVVVRFGTEHP